MTQLNTRALTLQAQARCPVCGAAQVEFRAFSAGSALVRHACGGMFSTFANQDIRAYPVCPVPARVAADELEREAAAKEGGECAS